MGILPSDPRTQRLVLLGALPLIGLFAYWYFVHDARAAAIDQLEQKLEQLQAKNATAKTLAAQAGPELKRKLALYEQHAIRLEELIPKTEEVPDLLHDITLRAEESGVELNLMRPEKSVRVEPYTRQVYSMSVFGPYDGIGRFLAAVGSLPRIITPVHLKLVPRTEQDRSGAVRLQADFQIQTYVVQPPPAAPAGPPVKGKPANAKPSNARK